jgi:hypothetical protein
MPYAIPILNFEFTGYYGEFFFKKGIHMGKKYYTKENILQQ